ncbi:uncharacterized protein VDAG_01654 [Verticillium dahliae VdLs.17]|uniref:Uncharacterized protein n=1 Tax=Verticillium dahliae (strain VdLs.17 / ATCC MYA-4575 / FGSC 10137) TaxID=498257 RepID=G2WVL8_VERDV|nr:uncharacterized protein VDAG_01654 [Verticillium dahliae VdLs.17]EGY19638.1 hypothetical protein VDAG_01654 [Verticillium dahliae VdLs.17]
MMPKPIAFISSNGSVQRNCDRDRLCREKFTMPGYLQ